jgi:hypothetical protein
MSWCPTVRIVAANADGYCVINEADFDSAKHKRWVDPLDHDGDGRKGGAKPKGKAKAAQDEEAGDPPLTRREVEADLTAADADFDPAADLVSLRAERDAVKGKV